MHKEAREKLVDSLLNNYDILDGFVVWGLENGLQNILEEIELILKMKHIPDHKWQDLVDLCYDGKAFIRVLRYHTTLSYDKEMIVINKGFDKQREWI